MKTGIKFKPCNVGTAEAHNRREQKYIDAINRKYGKTYFWTERTHLNESWRNPDYAENLSDTLEQLKVLVKEKTGRAMQMKSRERVDRKTGKVKVIAGSSAIREGCPPIKPNTTIEDFNEFKAWLASKNITLISIDLHRDEGHIDEESGKLKVNNHAHVIVDWIDHQTGKSVKLSKSDCEEMQTVLARSLGMERGASKQDTGIEGLNAIEYKEKMAQQHYQELQERNASLETDNVSKQRQCDRLDAEIRDKSEKANRENGSKILEGTAAIVNVVAQKMGMGKYKQMEKDNDILKSKIDELSKVIDKEVQKRTAELSAELEKVKIQLRESDHASIRTIREHDAAIDKVFALEKQFNKKLEEKNELIDSLESSLRRNILTSYLQPCPNSVPMDIDYTGDGEYRTFYIPQVAKQVWDKEFSWRYDSDDVIKSAASLFVGLIMPKLSSLDGGIGGVSNDLPWRDKHDDDEKWARRCAAAADGALRIRRRGRGR